MFKKILVGALLVGVIGVLIAGAVNRTNAKAGEGTASEVGRRGRATETAVTGTGNGGRGGLGQGGGREAQGGQAVTGGGRGGFGQGGGQGRTEVAPALPADAVADGWSTVTGTVVSVADDLVEIESAAGAVIPFEGQPLSFARGQGLSLKLGDAVTLAGYDESGEFKIGKVTNLSDDGATVVLRDASGRPGWAGRGRRS